MILKIGKVNRRLRSDLDLATRADETEAEEARRAHEARRQKPTLDSYVERTILPAALTWAMRGQRRKSHESFEIIDDFVDIIALAAQAQAWLDQWMQDGGADIAGELTDDDRKHCMGELWAMATRAQKLIDADQKGHELSDEDHEFIREMTGGVRISSFDVVADAASEARHRAPGQRGRPEDIGAGGSWENVVRAYEDGAG